MTVQFPLRRRKKLAQRLKIRHLFPILLVSFVALSTVFLLHALNHTPHSPRLRHGKGNTLYVASNNVYTAQIGTKDNSPTVNFQINGSSATFTLAGIDQTKGKKTNRHTILYQNILPATDLQYTTLPNGVKEKIILKALPPDNSAPNNIFLFDLNLAGTTPKTLAQRPDGVISLSPFFTDKNGNYLFHFEKPFAADAAGNRTDNVLLQIGEDRQIPGKYYLKLIVDSTWLNSSDRIYPITIDPTIVHDTSSEFSTGTFNRAKDTGSGSYPSIETYYQELPADEHTVGLWHMNETADNSCSGGEDVCDSSGNGHHGTATGTSIVDGKLNKARSFNGTSDLVTISDSSDFDLTNSFTISLWINFSSLNTQRILGRYVNSDAKWTLQFHSTRGLEFWDQVTGGSNPVFVSQGDLTGWSTNTWYHIAVVRSDGDYYKIYRNGVEIASQTTTADLEDLTAALTIGKHDTVYFGGKIDDLRIDNTFRTPEEIKAAASRRPYSVYTSDVIDLTAVASWTSFSWDEWGVATGDGETLKDSTGLVAQWNFNETSGTTADNSEGTAAYDGTLTNMTTTGQDDAAGDGWTANNKRWGTGALMFDGTDGYVDIGTGPTSVKTVEFWVKPFTTTEYFINLTSTTDYISASSGTISATGFTNPTFYVDGVKTDQIVAGEWQHVVVTTDTAENASNLDIGRTADTNYFQGVMDSVRLYSRALTEHEILSNYNSANIEFQTRVGSDTSPNDGSWEAWKPTTEETTIDNMDNPLDWATPSASIYSNVRIATSSSSTIKFEGTKSLQIDTGSNKNFDSSTVALWHLEETGGTGAYIKDSTTNANDGTPTSTTIVDGFIGKGKGIDQNEYITFPASADWNFGTGDWAIELWINYQSGASSNYKPIINLDTPSGSRSFWLDFGASTPTNPLIQFYDYNNSCGTSQYSFVPYMNQWSQVTVTRVSGVVYLYANGTLLGQASCAGSMGNSTSTLYINRDPNNSARFVTGKVDEVRITKGAGRSAEEVAESYRSGRGHYINKTISSTDLSSKTSLPFYIAADRPGTYLEATVGESAYANHQPDSNTVGLWHLEEESGSGAYIKDSSGNGNHGTPTNTSFTNGPIGKARYFAGADQINFGDPALSNGDDITVSLWVKAGSQVNKALLDKSNWTNNPNGFLLYTNPGGTIINFNIYGLGTLNTGNYSVLDNEWHLITGVVNSGTSYSLYVDGQLVSTASTTGNYTAGSTTLMLGDASGGGRDFTGYLDEPRLDKTARSASEIRQAYEIGRRTHPITIDFAASLDSGNLITGSSDVSFTVDATAYGLNQKGSALYKGDKIIVRENYDGTEYIAQGTVTAVTESTGAVTVSSWDSGSTFPSSGFTANASVFKWQREYWPITDNTLSSHMDAITNLTLKLTNGSEGRTIWLDDLKSNSNYLTDKTGSTIASSTGNQYFQYRAILSSLDEAVSATLSAVTIDYVSNSAPATPSLDSPSDTATNQSLTPILKTTTTDSDSDYLRYKIELCTDSAMTANCQTFDQTSSQTGWSGQDAQSSTAYASGTQGIYTVQSNLSTSTTYYWRSYAIDPGGTNTWSSTQSTPYSFTTTSAPLPATNCRIQESSSDSLFTIIWTDVATNEDNYEVERSVNGGAWSDLATGLAANTESQTDSSISQGNTYRYRIAPYFSSGPIYADWCYTDTLSLQSGSFSFEGLNFSGLNLN